MDEANSGPSAFESVERIVKHPWIILFTFLIIFNVFHAYAISIPPQFRAQGKISFEAVGDRAYGSRFDIKKAEAEKLVSGEAAAIALKDIFKDASPKERERDYKNLESRLQAPKSGLRMTWLPQAMGHTLTIDFSYSNPTLCYKVVKAIFDLIISESTRKATREMEKSISFLKQQISFYGDKIGATNREIGEVRTELLNRYPELSSAERELIARSAESVDIVKEDAVQKYAAHEETKARLSAELIELQKQRADLARSLESGSEQSLSIDIAKEDSFLTEYAKAIAAKDVEIASLESKGFKSAHPMVKQLQHDIDLIKEMRKKRMSQLRGSVKGTPQYEEMKEKIDLAIEEVDFKIYLIKNKINAIDEMTKAATTELKSLGNEKSDIKEKVSRLMALKSEKDINQRFLEDMKKKLADAELKYRAEKESIDYKISVVEEPEVPAKPDPSTTRAIVLKGLFLGLLAGLGLAYAADRFSVTMRSAKELSDHLGVPALASIDRIATRQEIAAEHKRLLYAFSGTVAIMIISRIVIFFMFSGK